MQITRNTPPVGCNAHCFRLGIGIGIGYVHLLLIAHINQTRVAQLPNENRPGIPPWYQRELRKRDGIPASTSFALGAT